MSSFIIRPAEPRDDHAVGELLVTSFMTAYARKLPEVVYSDDRKRELRAVADKRSEAIVLVAEEAGEVIGTVMLYPPGARASEAWLANTADIRQLAVLPRCFGRRLSGPLMDAAEAAAWALGVSAISLHTRASALGVQRLYERRGYQRDPVGDLVLPEVHLLAFVLRPS